MAKIVVIPGHFGDYGTTNHFTPGYNEEVITKRIADELVALARSWGHSVYLSKQFSAAQELVQKVKPDVVVEIHINSTKVNPGCAARGVQVYVASGNRQAYILGSFLLDSITKETGFQRAEPRKVIPVSSGRAYSCIKYYKNFPHALTENGFICNKYDEEMLRKPQVIKGIARGHLVGIHRYLGLPVPLPPPPIPSTTFGNLLLLSAIGAMVHPKSRAFIFAKSEKVYLKVREYLQRR